MWMPSYLKVIIVLFVLGLITVIGYKFVYKLIKERISGEVQ